jgi:alkylation response protein AidB-like acyl-CoA dehydrogenase
VDFLLTEDQRAFRYTLRAWLDANLPANWRNGKFVTPVDEVERGRFFRAWENKIFKAGYAGLHWPKAYGGHGLSLVEHFIYGEETGRVAAPIGINPIGRELVAGVLLHAGSEEQKLRFLPKIAACEHVWCQGFSEPNSGSDLTSLKTHAELRDGIWYVTGQKIWTSYAQHADYCLLLARTSKEEHRRDGISLMAVPMDAPGITRRGIQQLDGTWDFNEVMFDNVPVDPANIIGPLGEGWQTSGAVLAIERATTRLYRQQRYVNELRHAYAVHADGGGRDAAHSDHLRQKIATSYSKLLALRAVNIEFVSRLVAGEKVGSEASISKQCWSLFHQDATATIAELMGDNFWFPPEDERDCDRFLPEFFHSRAETLFAGTSEIQKTIIAEQLLGMPR